MFKHLKNKKNSIDLHKCCRNATNENNDNFVGIKSEFIDGVRNISINFPLGYKLPENENQAREDIILLINILTKYGEKSSELIFGNERSEEKENEFPINAYLNVIREYYSRNGYYKESTYFHSRGNTGIINYNKTIRKENPIVLENGFIFLNNQVKRRKYLDDSLITKINEFCVYESFLKIGWLYNEYLPQKPDIENESSFFQTIIKSKLNNTYKDSDIRLFNSMLDILDYKSNEEKEEVYFFGTHRFEYIWENIVDKVFGVKYKEKFFPRTYWKLNSNEQRKNMALEPDTIMLYGGNIYVLDAKYYKFGVTGKIKDLPNSSSINKQITYGEYIAKSDRFRNDNINNRLEVYNAFIMPYCSDSMLYEENCEYINIGEATADWKNSKKEYERVQGILVDTKYIMKVANRRRQSEIVKLSNKINF